MDKAGYKVSLHATDKRCPSLNDKFDIAMMKGRKYSLMKKRQIDVCLLSLRFDLATFGLKPTTGNVIEVAKSDIF